MQNVSPFPKNIEMDEPKIYKKWNKNYTNFETIYLGDKKFIWVEKAKDRKIDLILDKISKSGYDSLTKSEKNTLFKAGEK